MVVLLALVALIALGFPGAARARVLLVGSWHGHQGSFRSIQAAVDVARRGDWVLVGPGDYHERGDRDRRYRSLAEHGAGVMITTAGHPRTGNGSQSRRRRRDQARCATVQPLRDQTGLRAAR